MDIQLYALRIFCQAVKDRTFSQAAKSLGITQPNVSQQIARLEAELDSKLFERVGHDVHLTSVGKELLLYATDVLDRTDGFSEALRSQKSQPSGLVRYAMPESCQWTPHYRKIMQQIREFPEIRFEIGILPNDQTIKGLLEGELDFGFIVGERLNPELRFEKFSDERYSAVAADTALFAPFKKDDPSSLRIISYPGWELFFTAWAKAFGLWGKMRDRLTQPTVRIGTLAGAIHATQEGAGIGIIPTHCVMQELKNGSLKEYRHNKTGDPLNPVHIARRTGEKLPRRVELVLNMLKTAKQELG